MPRHPNDPRPSEITPQAAYLDRRRLLAGAAGAAFGLSAGRAFAGPLAASPATAGPYLAEDKRTPREDVTSYNNYYEFGTSKDEPSVNAKRLTTKPWTVKVDGLVDKPGNYALDDLLKGIALEERVYRMRCVEAWSMVIPWIGVPLAAVLAKVSPQPSAKYVAFETALNPDEMTGVGGFLPVLEWPYREGLRLDEAMNPLAILATGLYGETLPNQNGAPIRLVVPWKYGFKGIKSIVRISLVEKQPATAWNLQNAREYGFYANVNPAVDHPRWSQATERRIGESGLFVKRRPTLMFNGYADQVASLYSGMDLRTSY